MGIVLYGTTQAALGPADAPPAEAVERLEAGPDRVDLDGPGRVDLDARASTPRPRPAPPPAPRLRSEVEAPTPSDSARSDSAASRP